MIQLPTPLPGVAASVAFVANHLGHLLVSGDQVSPSVVFRGGQTAADEALQAFDVTGYAAGRSQAYPQTKRSASQLSPWIRHGFLSLGEVWDHVEGSPDVDVSCFRDELLWQEYARHWYARLGTSTAQPVRHDITTSSTGSMEWDTSMGCIEAAVDELEDDGWLVNQTRMWLASHWAVRHGHDWRTGEDYFFRHLLDGSRAANRQGWQWVSGAGSSKQHGFSRWQVEKWAAGLCGSCELSPNCPIEEWPDSVELEPVEEDARLRADPDLNRTAGPQDPLIEGSAEVVWMTAESLGDDDPAAVANPDLPIVFVFDEPLLRRLELSSKRLIFMAESLAELATKREVQLWLGDPVEVLRTRSLAATFAPVPGWRKRSAELDIPRLYPWRWLVRPHAGSIRSFSRWRTDAKKLGVFQR